MTNWALGLCSWELHGSNTNCAFLLMRPESKFRVQKSLLLRSLELAKSNFDNDLPILRPSSDAEYWLAIIARLQRPVCKILGQLSLVGLFVG